MLAQLPYRDPSNHTLEDGVRFVLELVPTSDGRVEGSVGRDGVEPTTVPFSGWLELLTLLETSVMPASAPTADDAPQR
jgi:hypothetical protein